MNLAQLIEYAGSLLDYDPTNPTYRSQLVEFLNAAQQDILGDREWDFAQTEQSLHVKTDETYTLTLTAGALTVTGTGFDYSADPVLPGSSLELATIDVTDSAGLEGTYQIRFVAASNLLYIDRPFEGTTGSYACTVKYRATYLPPNTSSILGVRNPALGIPATTPFMSKMSREDLGVNPDLLGTAWSWTPWEPLLVPAPRLPYGVTVATPGAGRGVRTIYLYAANVYAPRYWGHSTYPGYSGGFESSLSTGVAYSLTDTQDLEINPAAVSGQTGWYRRYYFTCPDEGVYAPRRIRSLASGGTTADTDTLAPTDASTVIYADTSLSVIQSAAISQAPRYDGGMSGAFNSFLLYPHPSADQDMIVRWLRAPQRLEDDTDTALIPAAFSRLIALGALIRTAQKLTQAALAQSYQADAMMLQRRMEAQYLAQPQRRLIKGQTVQPSWPPWSTFRFVP